MGGREGGRVGWEGGREVRGSEMGGREGGGYERVDGMGEWMVWEVMYIDGATFDVSLHRGVGAMEIVAMDMKVSCHRSAGTTKHMKISLVQRYHHL